MIINKKYKEIFDINLDNKMSQLYQYNQSEKDLKDINKKIINKVKYFIYSILNNYNLLNIDDFDEIKISNIPDILKELRKNMKSLNILIDKTIPSEWYIDSLLDFLKKLPKNLICNDYEQLLTKLEEDLNNSIQNLHFREISLFLDKVKNINKLKDYYDKVINSLENVKLNRKIDYIIKKKNIPIEIIYKKNKNYLSFNISDTNVKKTNKNKINIRKKSLEINNKNCRTIEEFINKFPNVSKRIYTSKNTIFSFLKKNNFPQQIENYVQKIHNSIKNDELNKEKELDLLVSKIYDYIMEQIYNKIFPPEPDPLDNMIYLNCKKAEWIEPKHLLKENDDFILSNFISDVSYYIDKMMKQKCPTKKYFYMEEIFKSIYNLSIFNGKKLEGVDEEMQALNFALIKAKPKKINSNCEYMQLFLRDKKGKREDNHLTQMFLISSQIAKLNHTFLINVTEEQYYEKCKKNLLKFI